MKATRLALYGLALLIVSQLALTVPAAAQGVLPFSVGSAHAYRLANGCVGLKVGLETRRDIGAPADWKATVLYVAQKLQDSLKFDSLDLELRRGDEAERPRDESGLARVMLDITARCQIGDGRLMYVAQRALTAQDLRMRDLYHSMTNNGVPEERVQAFVAKEFKLKRDFILPRTGWSRDQSFTLQGVTADQAMPDIGIAIERSREAIAKLPKE